MENTEKLKKHITKFLEQVKKNNGYDDRAERKKILLSLYEVEHIMDIGDNALIHNIKKLDDGKGK